MDELIDHFMAITAADRQTAEMFLEMSQYDMDAAIQFYFENGGDVTSGASFSSPPVGSNAGDTDLNMIFGSNTIPDSWICQGLAFDYFPESANPEPWAGLGIVQVSGAVIH